MKFSHDSISLLRICHTHTFHPIVGQTFIWNFQAAHVFTINLTSIWTIYFYNFFNFLFDFFFLCKKFPRSQLLQHFLSALPFPLPWHMHIFNAEAMSNAASRSERQKHWQTDRQPFKSRVAPEAVAAVLEAILKTTCQ